MRYSASNVLLTTKHNFMATFANSPLVPLRQVISYMSKSYEFSSQFNKEIKVRPSDNVEIPPLIKHIPEFTVFKKAIVGAPYEVKARALIYAHLMRLGLSSDTLRKDEVYIIKQCPKLLNEMINSCVSMMTIFSEHCEDRNKRLVAMDHLVQSMENCMELIPMVIQAILDASPLTQLPHVDAAVIKGLSSGGKSKIVVKSVAQLAALPDKKRRLALHSLSDEQYNDVINVLCTMPQAKISADCEVADEDESVIWPMTVVTCKIKLERVPLCEAPVLGPSPTSLATSGNNYSPRHVAHSLSEDEQPHDPISDKFEGWWMYIIDRKNKRLVVAPQYIANLQRSLKMDVKFMSPQQVGQYLYTVYLRSDSYIDFVFSENVKFTVEPLPESIRKQILSSMAKSGYGHHSSDSGEDSQGSSADEAPRTKRKEKLVDLYSDEEDESSAYESEAERIYLAELSKKAETPKAQENILSVEE
ncbi:secretory subunit [Cichlidogyrus casuarinus]|uniref:Secretory subunit n=1 Tax=Cichlidogyrus casuarinus TaxID=1844966 RepID=A0ABD2Q7P2_9PLAT